MLSPREPPLGERKAGVISDLGELLHHKRYAITESPLVRRDELPDVRAAGAHGAVAGTAGRCCADEVTEAVGQLPQHRIRAPKPFAGERVSRRSEEWNLFAVTPHADMGSQRSKCLQAYLKLQIAWVSEMRKQFQRY